MQSWSNNFLCAALWKHPTTYKKTISPTRMRYKFFPDLASCLSTCTVQYGRHQPQESTQNYMKFKTEFLSCMSHIPLVATIFDSEDNRSFPSLQKVLLGTYACCCLVTKSCPTLLRPHGLWPARLFCPRDFQARKLEQVVIFCPGDLPNQGPWQAGSLPLTTGKPAVPELKLANKWLIPVSSLCFG